MRALLVSQLPQFSRTLTEKMMTYALGRGLKPFDRRAVDAVQRAVVADGYRFQDSGPAGRSQPALPLAARGKDELSGVR